MMMLWMLRIVGNDEPVRETTVGFYDNKNSRKTNIYTAGTTCVVPETMFDGCLEVYADVTNGLLLRTAVRIIDIKWV